MHGQAGTHVTLSQATARHCLINQQTTINRKLLTLSKINLMMDGKSLAVTLIGKTLSFIASTQVNVLNQHTQSKGQIMRVYLKKQLIVIETNLAWALPYWTERKRLNKNIHFSIN